LTLGATRAAAGRSSNVDGAPAAQPITPSIPGTLGIALNVNVPTTVASCTGCVMKPSPALATTQPSAVVASATTESPQTATLPLAPATLLASSAGCVTPGSPVRDRET